MTGIFVFLLICAVVAAFALVPATAAQSHNLVDRIQRYRNAGFANDGIHLLRGYQIDDLDYALMGAENASAKINHPGKDVTRGAWFAINPHSPLASKPFANSHGSYVGGKIITESAYTEVTLPDFWPSPEEVIWHHERVTKLRPYGADSKVCTWPYAGDR